MRVPTALIAALIACLGAAAAAQATHAAQRVTADPRVVDRASVQTVRGSGWPVFENCSRTVRISVRSAQNSARIGQRRVRANGRFTFRWIPRNKNIGPGRWRLIARMRCESGRDGSPFIVHSGTLIRIRP